MKLLFKTPFAIFVLLIGLSGCAIVQAPSLERLDNSLNRILGMSVENLVEWLGEPAVLESDGALTRYGWLQPDLVQPCTLEVWINEKGIIKKTAREGYERSCKPFADRIL